MLPEPSPTSRWTARGALGRSAEVLREEGARALWFKALGEIAYRRLLILEASLADLPAPAPAARSLEFAFVDAEELGENARLRRGDRCFGTWLDGRLVATRWVAVEEAVIDYLDCRLQLAPGVAYVYDAYTAPEARGGGIFPATWWALAGQLATEGIHTILGSVLPENRVARRALGKLPYRVSATFGFVRLGPWRRCFLRGRTTAARRA